MGKRSSSLTLRKDMEWRGGRRQAWEVLRAILDEASSSRPLQKRYSNFTLPWTLSLQLENPSRIAQLKGTFLGLFQPTDILSFPAPGPFQERGFLGELVICPAVIREQAKAFQNTPREELQVVLIHGLLHLLGFDHERGKLAAQEMRAWESLILKKIQRRASLLGLIERQKFVTRKK